MPGARPSRSASKSMERIIGPAEVGAPEAEFGPGLPEVTMTSPTAPGVVRRWTTAKAFTDEVSVARIYGGIHYRTSMVVGQAMGRKIGEFAVQQYLKPIH